MDSQEADAPEVRSDDVAELICELEPAAFVFPAWPALRDHCDRIMSALHCAEHCTDLHDSRRWQYAAAADKLLDAPISTILRPSSTDRPATRAPALGPIEQSLVHVVRQGLREEEPFMRSLLRAELRCGQPRSASPERVLTTADAAAIAGVTAKTIRAWVKSGRLEPLGGSPYKFRRAEVERARDRRPSSSETIDFEARADELLDRKRGR